MICNHLCCNRIRNDLGVLSLKKEHVGIYKRDAAFLKFLYCLYIILHYSHWLLFFCLGGGVMCIIYSSYKQHLTNKRKERQTTEKSTVGSEAQRRWELFECKWVLTSAAHVHQTAGGTGSSCFSETRRTRRSTNSLPDDCWEFVPEHVPQRSEA